MARQDLEALRDEIISLGFLSLDEAERLRYYGQNRLLETLAIFEAVAEVEIEEMEREETDDRDERKHFDRDERDYGDWYDEPDYGDWEVEITFTDSRGD